MLGASSLGISVKIRAVTPVYVTADIRDYARFRPPLRPRPRYANAVLEVAIPTPPLLTASRQGLSEMLKDEERHGGRLPEHKAVGLVSLDLDLVTFGNRLLRPADFVRPYFHPRAAML